jgi:hypothetical protein
MEGICGWIGQLMNTDLITRITGLLTQGKDPTSMFADKNTDRDFSEAMKQKFHTVRGVCGLDVPNICDPTIITCDIGISMQDPMEMKEGPSANRSDSCDREVCGRDLNELGTLPFKPSFLLTVWMHNIKVWSSIIHGF